MEAAKSSETSRGLLGYDTE